ncbi:hypothetical protein [Plantactinospora sp. CA-290183]|uniref:hypothetical protein n=1 Tax=Plantactinospora sp. CA-290183 TaxID=3240006 RepID=UPI003D91CA2C
MINDQVVSIIAVGTLPMLGTAVFLLSRERVQLKAATVFLLAGTAGVVAVLAGALWTRSPWLLALAAAQAILATMVWPVHAMVRTGRLNWFCLMLARAVRTGRTPTGACWQTMEQLRAEYGQTVLDDATRDPVLDDLLTQAARQFEAALAADASPLPLDTQITMYANGVVEAFSDPPEKVAQIRHELPPDRRQRWLFPRYCGYAPFMLAIATMCRAYDSARAHHGAAAQMTRLRPSTGAG